MDGINIVNAQKLPEDTMANSTFLVLELQELAADGTTDIGELLRKALLVATKLGLSDFRHWAHHELNGYRGADADVPEYRKANAEIKLKNPYHGLIPCIIKDTWLSDILCRVEIRDPVGNLVNLLGKPNSESGLLTIPLPHMHAAWLMEQQGDYAQLPPVRVLGRNHLSIIIEGIRNTILEWCIRLEADGILGEGMTFSSQEKKIAAMSSNINIQNFQGVLGNVSDSKVTQILDMKVRQGNFESLRLPLRNNGINDAELNELQQAIEAEPQPPALGKFGERVSAWIGKMVGKAANGTWHISVGAAGNLLGDAIGAYYGL